MANTKVPDGWYRTTLGKVAKLTMGQSPASDTYNTENDGLPFFQGKADFGSRYPKTRYWCSAPTKIVDEQSILFSVRAPVGDVNITPYECCIGRGLAGIQGDSVNQEFLFQKLQHAKPQFQLLSQGSTFEAVNGSDLKEFDLILPPLPEQQKIATILTSVDTVIEKTRAQIDKLKDLKTGMMQQLLTQGIGHTEFKNTTVGRIPETWKVKTLGDLIKSMDGGVSVNGENREKVLNEIGVLKVSSVFKGQFLPQEHKAVVPEDVSRVRLNPKKDHILFSRANTPLLVGESAYIDKDYNDLFLPDKLWMIDVKSRTQVNVKWLSYVLCSDQVRKDITDAATGSSSTMKNISKPSLLGISTVLPPIIEQKKISDMLQSVDEKTIVTIQKLKKLTKIKKALMQDLLTGKVRVQSLKKL